ncbi:MAG: helix-turn-helix transcriptional regulator [Selenomonadaceae bacterium]|nr:helix-turn-helix transcriptional regulator [Selenomonadaceae bacterium]MBO6305806.1 helix-turn-helix transcriptional regulator [Selenomonadaceae bacterium]
MDISKKILFKQIGAKIAYYRTLRNMTQRDLAKRANISRSALSRIECGKYNDNVSVSLLFDIADGLRIDTALLMTFNETEKQMWWQEIQSESDDEIMEDDKHNEEEEPSDDSKQ